MSQISDGYRRLNFELHRANKGYGRGGWKHSKEVRRIAKALKTEDVLDYGCGKGSLATRLGFKIAEYDPAIKTKRRPPKPADIVVCTDVLEHVEPEHLQEVLADLRRCVKRLGYFVVANVPSNKKLSDGRNAHLIQESHWWWFETMCRYFEVVRSVPLGKKWSKFIVAPTVDGLSEQELSVISELEK